MGDGGLLSLSWNNHKATFCHILSTLREKERYTDVTLACDGKFYPVHKLVLSTCSEYFESMFEHTPCKHPIIVLKDLKCDEVESLLSYMYAGVVNVAQSDLARLIKAAELLKVKGLAVPDEPPQETENRRSSPSWNNRDERTSPPPKRRRRDSDGTREEQHTGTTSPAPSPRNSPYHSSEHHQDNSRTSNEGHSEHRSERTIDRLEQEVRSDVKCSSSDLNPDHHHHHTPAKPHSPIQVMLEETLVKEEILDPLPEEKDDLLNSGMDYGSMSSDGRIDNPGSDPTTQDHQMLSAKYEQQSLGASQSHHLPEAVVEALAGPSGMQGWLGGGEMGGSFPGVEGYGGDSRHQDLRQSLSTQQPQPQPQAHPMVGPENTRDDQGARAARPRRHATTSDRMHKCSYCSYVTVYVTNYKNHLRTHTGEKPHSCPYCVYRTTTKKALTHHIRTHTGEKPYSCSLCAYGAATKQGLTRHSLIHTGEKPFACKICPYRAREKSALRNHTLAMHTLKQ